MPSTVLVIHERLGTWGRQLRRRLVGSNAPRFVETRSVESLERAISGLGSPIVVIDLADRAHAMLSDLVLAVHKAPGGFFLVLDPNNQPGVARLAREIGATCVLSGWTPPPDIADLIERWLPLAKLRGDRDGWSVPLEPEPEPWERLDAFAAIAAPFSPDPADA